MPGSTPPERTLITGAGGQLGRALVRGAPAGVELRACGREALDIGSLDAIAHRLDEFRPDLLINAAAYTAVDRAEEDADAAFAINAEAPGLLARACAARGVRLLHVSTDFVFDGRQSSPYAADARSNPLGVYGASKRAGEEAVLAADATALILRTGWVYSAGPGNFLSTMLRLHGERDELGVVADQVGTPTAAGNLAAALWSFAARPALAGIYHFSDAGVCSWYDFAQAIGEEAVALGLLKRAARVKPIRSVDYPTPATRPPYSVLDKTTTWTDAAIEPQHWREALRRTLADLKQSTTEN
jgi:dTDP-4-dehydrorhamnose reductase